MVKSLDQPVRIACLGECMIELSDLTAVDGRVCLGVGGDTLNTAVYLARSLPRDRAVVSYLTALGHDHLSTRMLKFIAEEGIDTTLVVRLEDRLPGLYAIESDPAGERRFHYWRNRSAARSMFRPGALDIERLESFELIYLSGISLAILSSQDRDRLLAKLHELKAAGRTIAFDSNYRPTLWSSRDEARSAIAQAWRATTIALPSLDDEIALQGPSDPHAVIERIAGMGTTEIALKRGPEGPLVWFDGDLIEGRYQPARTVRDTTAAGDSFNAGYLAARVRGQAPDQAARAGHSLASHVVQHQGAIVAVV